MFATNRNFPIGLLRRVRRYYRYYYATKTAINERDILQPLSKQLRDDVANFLCTEVIGGIDLFDNIDRDKWAEMLPYLKPSEFERGQIITVKGQKCTEMYMVLQGRLETSSEKWTEAVKDKWKKALIENGGLNEEEADEELKTMSEMEYLAYRSGLSPDATDELLGHQAILRKYEYFGELSVLDMYSYSIETIQASTTGECYSLGLDHFREIFGDVEDLEDLQQMQKQAESRYFWTTSPQGMPMPTHRVENNFVHGRRRRNGPKAAAKPAAIAPAPTTAEPGDGEDVNRSPSPEAFKEEPVLEEEEEGSPPGTSAVSEPQLGGQERKLSDSLSDNLKRKRNISEPNVYGPVEEKLKEENTELGVLWRRVDRIERKLDQLIDMGLNSEPGTPALGFGGRRDTRTGSWGSHKWKPTSAPPGEAMPSGSS